MKRSLSNKENFDESIKKDIINQNIDTANKEPDVISVHSQITIGSSSDDNNNTLTIDSSCESDDELSSGDEEESGTFQQEVYEQLSSDETFTNANEIKIDTEKVCAELIQDLMKNSKIGGDETQYGELLCTQNFMKILYIIETFNNVVYTIYKDKFKLAKICLKRFLTSLVSHNNAMVIRNDEDSEYFALVIRMVVELAVFVQTPEKLKNVTFCNLSLDKLVEDAQSTENIGFILMRYLTCCAKKIVEYEELEVELQTIEALNDLSFQSKLKLSEELVKYLAFQVRDHTTHYIYNTTQQHLERSQLEISKAIKNMKEKILNFKICNGFFNQYIVNDVNKSEKLVYLNGMNEDCKRLKINLDNLAKELKCMQNIEPFGCLELNDDSGVFILFWKFDSLDGCLIIEKRSGFDIASSENSFQSDWFLISDINELQKLKEAVKYNFSIYNQIVDVIKINRAQTTNSVTEILKSIETVRKSGSDDSTKDQTFDQIRQNDAEFQKKCRLFLEDIIDLKYRILIKNMVSYHVSYDPKDKQIISFEMNESSIEEFEQNLSTMLSASNTIDVEKLKKMLELIYEMIDKTYLNRFGAINWLSELHACMTVNKLELMYHVLSTNIIWNRFENEQNCHLCESKKSTETTNDENNNNVVTTKATPQADYVHLPTEQCSNCEISYHLECLINSKSDFRKSQETSKETPNLYKCNKFSNKVVCNKCHETKQSEREEIDKKRNEELPSIEINNYSLRLNKSRIESLETGRNTKRKSRSRISSDSESEYGSKSKKSSDSLSDFIVDDDYSSSEERNQRKKKGLRKKNRIRYVDDDDDDDEDNESIKSASEDMKKAEEEREEKRARLGLRSCKKINYNKQDLSNDFFG